MAVIAIVVRESRFREKATRFDEAVDRPLRCLVPTDIESEQLRKELQLAVWKIVMNPPCHCLPARRVHSIDQPRHNDRRQRAHAAVFASAIPGMAGSIFLVRSAAETMPASEVIDLGRPIRGANCDAAERRLQGLQEILTEPTPCGDRKLGIIGQIRQTFDRCDLAKQKVSHEEGLREPRS